MIAAVGLSFIAENIGLLEWNQEAIVIIGLVIGEITKHLNAKK